MDLSCLCQDLHTEFVENGIQMLLWNSLAGKEGEHVRSVKSKMDHVTKKMEG